MCPHAFFEPYGWRRLLSSAPSLLILRPADIKLGGKVFTSNSMISGNNRTQCTRRTSSEHFPIFLQQKCRFFSNENW